MLAAMTQTSASQALELILTDWLQLDATMGIGLPVKRVTNKACRSFPFIGGHVANSLFPLC